METQVKQLSTLQRESLERMYDRPYLEGVEEDWVESLIELGVFPDHDAAWEFFSTQPPGEPLNILIESVFVAAIGYAEGILSDRQHDRLPLRIGEIDGQQPSDLFLLQNNSGGYVGNSPVFWRCLLYTSDAADE